jgi:hypothetical protein
VYLKLSLITYACTEILSQQCWRLPLSTAENPLFLMHVQLQRAASAAEHGCTISTQLHAAASSSMSQLQLVQLHQVERWALCLRVAACRSVAVLQQHRRQAATAQPRHASTAAAPALRHDQRHPKRAISGSHMGNLSLTHACSASFEVMCAQAPCTLAVR